MTPLFRFVFGEVALISFAILVLTGLFLTMFYRPSAQPIVYSGAAERYQGRALPAACASIVELSHDVPGGLLFRRLHRGAAYLLVFSTYPFLERRLTAYDPAIDSHVCTRPLEVPVRAGLVLGGTAFVGVPTLVTTSDTLAKALHAPVEVVIWVFRVAVLVVPVPVGLGASARGRTLARRRARAREARGGRDNARDARTAGDRVSR